jgi:Ca-activated chloride channel family protein
MVERRRERGPDMKTTARWMMAAAAALLAPLAPAKTTSYEVACRVEPDRSVLPANEATRAVVKVTLDAPAPPDRRERPPVNLCVVLDRSGSMSGAKIENAKEAAIAALRRLNGRDLFSLVMYDHEVETLVPPQSAANTEWIEPRIRGIAPRGNTALFAGVSQGAAEVRKNLESAYVQRIILLSDGLANVGPSSPDDLGRLGASLMKERIAVTTVGVGTDYNEDLMAQLSRESDGNTYFVENSGALPRIFAAELGDVLSVVARDVTIRIEITGGARPLRVIGRDGRIRGNTVELRLNQLYGGQQKYALVEVEVPPTAEDRTIDVASAVCEYENVVTEKRCSSRGESQLRFSSRREEVAKSENRAVVKEVLYNAGAAAQEQAISLGDKGQVRDAALSLRRQAEEIGQKAREMDDSDLDGYADRLKKQADTLEAEGLAPAARKSLRADSFQYEMQQPTKQ